MFDESLEVIENLVVPPFIVGPVSFEVVVGVLCLVVGSRPCSSGEVVALFIVV
jgi:hypothetical protein